MRDSSSTDRFPVLWPTDWRKFKKPPTDVPWGLVAPFERQALKNHGLTLSDLAARGGVSPAELVAILERRRFFVMAAEEAVEKLEMWIADFKRKSET